MLNKSNSPGFLYLIICVSALICNRLFAQDEQTFPSAEDAAQALVSAAQKPDMDAIHALFGSKGRELISGDLVQASDERALFFKRIKERTRLTDNSDSSVTLDLGNDRWAFPIPLVKTDNKWHFDSAAGAQEILARRVGMDEIGAIQVCNAYVIAQREYASKDRLGDGVCAFAQNIRSTPPAHDGLFWVATAQKGEEISPLGPLVAKAREEGYTHPAKMIGEESAPYHGYYFKILTSQGKHAPGQAYSYMINGRMLAGFALVAWPSEWGNTGVMTFIVNQQGQVFQQNFGAETAALAKSISSYNPNDKWALAQ